MNSNVWVAIIAGGEGSRLFPYSSPDRPKQFCKINEKDTFIQSVIDNYKLLGVKPNHIAVITASAAQAELAKKQAIPRGVFSENFHQIEPNLDYGGAIREAAKFIRSVDKDAIIINTPSDQYVDVTANDDFKATIENAVHAAEQSLPVIIGVKISDLAVAMGCGHALYEESDAPCHAVTRFEEKPGKEEAIKILRAGNSACNTGICIWTVDTFFKYVYDGPAEKIDTKQLMDMFMPDLKIAVGSFEWHDCGTLKSFYEVSEKTPNHRNATICSDKNRVDRYDCLDSLFLCDEGYRLHPSGCRGVAVIVTTIDTRPAIAVIDINESERVKKLAEDFKHNKELLVHDFSILAHNNFVMYSNMSKEIITCFVCVDGYTVNAYHNRDGMIDVFVSSGSPSN